MIRVALIGTGIIGKTHYDCYKSMENVELVAIADAGVQAARERIGEDETPIYQDIDELLRNHEVDMVDICTPTLTHVPLSIKALEAGIHVICEKPMSISGEEAAKLTAASKKSDKKVMIAHVVRFMAPYMYLKSVFESGELGKLVSIDMKRISGIPRKRPGEWMQDMGKSGGVAIDMSIHDIDFCRFAFGEPDDVKGVHYTFKDNNNYIVSSLIYKNFVATVTGGWYNYDIPFRAEFLAVFQNGVLSLENGKLMRNGEEVDLSEFSVESNTGMKLCGAEYKEEIEYFISCIKTGKDPEYVMPESSEKTIRLIEKIVENAVEV